MVSGDDEKYLLVTSFNGFDALIEFTAMKTKFDYKSNSVLKNGFFNILGVEDIWKKLGLI